MTDLWDAEAIPEELRVLIAAERAASGPSGDVRERVLLRLVGTVGLATPAGLVGGALETAAANTEPPAASVAAASVETTPIVSTGAAMASLTRLARLARVAVIFGAGASAGAGGYHLVHREGNAVPPAGRSGVPRADQSPWPSPPRPEGSAGQSLMRPETPGPVNTSNSEARKRPGPIRPVDRGGGDDGLAVERNLLEIARSALARGQAEGALAALGRHAQEFPTGVLAEEREALWVQALVGTRAYGEARVRATAFNKRHPRSLFGPVVKQALRSIP